MWSGLLCSGQCSLLSSLLVSSVVFICSLPSLMHVQQLPTSSSEPCVTHRVLLTYSALHCLPIQPCCTCGIHWPSSHSQSTASRPCSWAHILSAALPPDPNLLHIQHLPAFFTSSEPCVLPTQSCLHAQRCTASWSNPAAHALLILRALRPARAVLHKRSAHCPLLQPCCRPRVPAI